MTEHATGASVAALLAAAVGLLALALAQVQSERDGSFKEKMQDLGSAWIPNAEGIGPYSGKETVFLLAWLVAWVALHFGLRGRDVNVKAWFGATMAILALATVLLWPPMWPLLGGE